MQEMKPELVPCPVCEKQVAEDAPLCPYCGTPVRKRIQQKKAEEEADRQRQDAERAKQADREATMKVILYGGGGILLLYILHLMGVIK